MNGRTLSQNHRKRGKKKPPPPPAAVVEMAMRSSLSCWAQVLPIANCPSLMNKTTTTSGRSETAVHLNAESFWWCECKLQVKAPSLSNLWYLGFRQYLRQYPRQYLRHYPRQYLRQYLSGDDSASRKYSGQHLEISVSASIPRFPSEVDIFGANLFVQTKSGEQHPEILVSTSIPRFPSEVDIFGANSLTQNKFGERRLITIFLTPDTE